MIPYGKHSIEIDDINSVVDTLNSSWITQGPKVQELEKALATYCGSPYAVVFANGSIALLGAYFAAGLKPDDEIISTPITFSATTNTALWFGAKPVFADINPSSGNLSLEKAAAAITSKTKVITPVDYAGNPCDVDGFQKLARDKNLILIEDACHAFGATYKGKPIGSLSDMTVFSFHPVKTMTTGEGGGVLTANKKFYERLVAFRDSGIVREEDWEYDVKHLGLNCRITDFQCALGLSQLKKVDSFINRRQEIANRYRAELGKWAKIDLLSPDSNGRSSWHLFVIKLNEQLKKHRRGIYRALRQKKIGVQVHYKPVYWHSLYSDMGYKKGICPVAEDFYERILSLPIYPGLTDEDLQHVIRILRDVLDSF